MNSNDYAEPAAALTTRRMPLLGFGTWQISNREAAQATAHALEAGYGTSTRRPCTTTKQASEGLGFGALPASRCS